MRILLLLALVIALPVGAAERLRILLTNDDGYESLGIKAVHKALTEAGHDVYVIAPAEQQSGAAASVTASGVRVTAYPNQIWAVHGRPADAVRVGLGNIMLHEPPHLVVSGANFGQNTGLDVNVSGTVGAALTAWHLGVPAIAISVEIKLDEAERGFPSTAGAFSGAARALVRLIRNMDLKDMTAALNMNYPARLPLDVKGVRWSALSDHSVFGERYIKTPDGFYRPQFQSPHKNARAHDAESLIDGFLTLTFLDGDIQIPTRRNQRYLDSNLLDRSNPSVPQAKSTPAARKKDQPAKQPTTARPTATRETSQPTVPQHRVAPTAVNEKSAPKQATPPARTSNLKERKPASSPIQLPEKGSEAEPPVAVSDSENQESPQNVPKPTADTGSGEQPKPDSWLRRMFDPGSWRR